MFRVEDIPKDMMIFDYLKGQLDWDKMVSVEPSRSYPDLIQMKFPQAHDLVVPTLDMIHQRGTFGWLSKEGRSKTYHGLSITYNPTQQYGIEPNASTLGAPLISDTQFYFGATDTHQNLRDSYYDTMGFRKLAPAVSEGALGDFLRASSRSLIRGRVAIIDGEKIARGYHQTSGWHRDESIFHCLRVNIPLQTDASYAFQIEGGEPVHLSPGHAYSWDTNRPHRAYQTRPSMMGRVHLVLGYSPWFDYLEKEDAWVPNKYCGVVHPFDLLATGQVHPWIHL